MSARRLQGTDRPWAATGGMQNSPAFGWIQTFPATSSLEVAGSDLIYSFSAASSSCCAYGKAALNMPVALT